MSIVKSKIVKQLSDSYPNFLKKDLEKLIDIFFNETKQALSREESVEIRSFGRFSVRTRDKRKARNPATGEVIEIPKKKNLYFKMSKESYKKLNKNE